MRKPPRRFSLEFQRAAVKRLNEGESGREIASELGINRQLIYKWRDQLESGELNSVAKSAREVYLEKENARLKQILANRDLEIDFFKGALQRIEDRRQQNDVLGARTSTTKSGK